MLSGGQGYGSRGWLPTARAELARLGLGAYWDHPRKAARELECAWRSRVYDRVEAAAEVARRTRMENMPSTRIYNRIKDWGMNPEAYSFSIGEIGRPGRLVPERYLDDRTQLKGTRLKALCRLDCLPVMVRVGREVTPKWPKRDRVCYACGTGVVEDVHHFVMECPRYAERRADLLGRVGMIMQSSAQPPKGRDRTGKDRKGQDQEGTGTGKEGKGQEQDAPFAEWDGREQYEILLGRRFGDPIAEDRIDAVVKRYLTKTWNMRAGVTAAINTALGTHYDVQTSALANRANGP